MMLYSRMPAFPMPPPRPVMLEEVGVSLSLHLLTSFSLFLFLLSLSLPLLCFALGPVVSWHTKPRRTRKHRYVLITLKNIYEQLRDLLLLQRSTPYNVLTTLAGLWSSRNKTLRSLEDVIITRRMATACLKCVSLTGILSWAILCCYSYGNVRTSPINPISKAYNSCQNPFWSETWQQTKHMLLMVLQIDPDSFYFNERA